MDVVSLKEFKQRLSDFEKRLTRQEKEHESYLERTLGLDDLGAARETLEDILRRLPEDDEESLWQKDRKSLNNDFASLLILISQ